MGSSTALTELTMQKYQRMQTCADVQRRSAWRPPYALTTALELLSIEVPRISSKHRGLATTTIVAVPHANDKRHIVGVKVVVWPFPLDTVIIEGQYKRLKFEPLCQLFRRRRNNEPDRVSPHRPHRATVFKTHFKGLIWPQWFLPNHKKATPLSYEPTAQQARVI